MNACLELVGFSTSKKVKNHCLILKIIGVMIHRSLKWCSTHSEMGFWFGSNWTALHLKLPICLKPSRNFGWFHERVKAIDKIQSYPIYRKGNEKFVVWNWNLMCLAMNRHVRSRVSPKLFLLQVAQLLWYKWRNCRLENTATIGITASILQWNILYLVY